MKYDLTVGIVTYNTEIEVLKRVLRCLKKIKLNIKIFISDNSEEDSLRKIIENLKDERIEYIFNNSNKGFGSGHNIIIDKLLSNNKTCSSYHLMINADVYFEDGVIENIVGYMNKNLEIGQIGPKIKDREGKLSYSCRLIPSPLNLVFRRFFSLKNTINKKNYEYEMRWYNYEDIAEVPILSGCFIFVRTKIFYKIGKFDERYFMYLEDYDLCRRIGEEYKIIYYPKVEIIHEHAKASYKSKKMLVAHIKSAIKYFNKWGWLFDKKRREINKRIKEKYIVK